VVFLEWLACYLAGRLRLRGLLNTATRWLGSLAGGWNALLLERLKASCGVSGGRGDEGALVCVSWISVISCQ
jgi:hypothetical protein